MCEAPFQKDSDQDYVQVGTIERAHGQAGRLRVRPSTGNPDRFHPGSTVLVGRSPYTVEAASAQGELLLVKFSGVDSLFEAEALAPGPIEILRSQVVPAPADTYYHFQLLGMRVLTATGQILGYLTEVLATGANDVYVVRDQESELLLPAIADVIKSVDVGTGHMVVEIPEGLEPRRLEARKSPATGRHRRRRLGLGASRRLASWKGRPTT